MSNLDDGAAGLWAIKSCGGTTVVQEPAEADHPEMPLNALMHTEIDHRLPLLGIAELLSQLANETVDAEAVRSPPESIQPEIEAAKLNGDIGTAEKLGLLSPFTCPSCRVALWELNDDGRLRFRCHIGHAYSPATLLDDQTTAVEQSLFVALRAVEEKADALRRLASSSSAGIARIKRDYENRARAGRGGGQAQDMLAGQKL